MNCRERARDSGLVEQLAAFLLCGNKAGSEKVGFSPTAIHRRLWPAQYIRPRLKATLRFGFCGTWMLIAQFASSTPVPERLYATFPQTPTTEAQLQKPVGVSRTPPGRPVETLQTSKWIFESVRRLASQPNLTVKRIVDEFGWTYTNRNMTSNSALVETTFNAFPLSKDHLNPIFRISKSREERRFVMPIETELMCIPESEIPREFDGAKNVISKGKSKVPTFLSEAASNRSSSDSKELKDISYLYGHSQAETVLIFSINVSGCVQKVSILESIKRR